jgi:DNA repair exonuclease SbcCD nuclease subunit
MKLLITGDWHLSDKCPVNRTDEDYYATCIDKLTQILEIAQEFECEVLVQPGDFFDTHRTSDYIKSDIIRQLSTFTQQTHCEVLTVFGQHDLRFHSNRINTPLHLLETAGVLHILTPETPLVYENDLEQVCFQGMSWNESDEQIKQGAVNISNCSCTVLVMHKMIVKNKLWDGQEEFFYGKNLFRRHPHDLFVCGDNHQSFTFSTKDEQRHVINCGSLLRSTSKQLEHKPIVYVYDTITKKCEPILLQVAPASECFFVDRIKKTKHIESELEVFIRQIDGTLKIEGLDFLETLEKVTEAAEIEKPVRKVIKQLLRSYVHEND